MQWLEFSEATLARNGDIYLVSISRTHNLTFNNFFSQYDQAMIYTTNLYSTNDLMLGKVDVQQQWGNFSKLLWMPKTPALYEMQNWAASF